MSKSCLVLFGHLKREGEGVLPEVQALNWVLIIEEMVKTEGLRQYMYNLCTMSMCPNQLKMKLSAGSGFIFQINKCVNV